MSVQNDLVDPIKRLNNKKMMRKFSFLCFVLLCSHKTCQAQILGRFHAAHFKAAIYVANDRVLEAAVKEKEHVMYLGGGFKLRFFSKAHVAPVQAKSQGVIDRILVKKSTRTLSLIAGDRIVKTYQISFGRTRDGHKECQGDGRTPEGVYYIDGRNPQSQYHRSLRISYPNAQDIANAQARGVDPGGDIMIHGLPPELTYLGKSHVTEMWTRGCVALTNEEMEEIYRLVEDGTLIEIVA